jgi:hypothetical protein
MPDIVVGGDVEVQVNLRLSERDQLVAQKA